MTVFYSSTVFLRFFKICFLLLHNSFSFLRKIHHYKKRFSSLHIFIHHCTFCASLHVKTSPGPSSYYLSSISTCIVLMAKYLPKCLWQSDVHRKRPPYRPKRALRSLAYKGIICIIISKLIECLKSYGFDLENEEKLDRPYIYSEVKAC